MINATDNAAARRHSDERECPTWCQAGAHEWEVDTDGTQYRWHVAEVSSAGATYSLQLMRLDHLDGEIPDADATLVRLDLDDDVLLPHQAIQLSADLSLAHIRAAAS